MSLAFIRPEGPGQSRDHPPDYGHVINTTYLSLTTQMDRNDHDVDGL